MSTGYFVNLTNIQYTSYIMTLNLLHDLLLYLRGKFIVLATQKCCQILKIYTPILRCLINYGFSIKCVIGKPIWAPTSTSQQTRNLY